MAEICRLQFQGSCSVSAKMWMFKAGLEKCIMRSYRACTGGIGRSRVATLCCSVARASSGVITRGAARSRAYMGPPRRSSGAMDLGHGTQRGAGNERAEQTRAPGQAAVDVANSRADRFLRGASFPAFPAPHASPAPCLTRFPCLPCHPCLPRLPCPPCLPRLPGLGVHAARP
jgi:hypothetical protein